LPSRGRTERRPKLRSQPVIRAFGKRSPKRRGGQLAHQQEANPVARFLELLHTAIATGRAHLATRNGGAGLTIQGRGLAAYTRPQHDTFDGRDGCRQGVGDAFITHVLRPAVSSAEGIGPLCLIFRRYLVEIEASMKHSCDLKLRLAPRRP